jgi:hypothetical protein
MMLGDLGLVPTVHRYSDAFKEQTGMDVNVTVTGNEGSELSGGYVFPCNTNCLEMQRVIVKVHR